jgi:LmbE family N-acetylglucosaminyl deacetylase
MKITAAGFLVLAACLSLTFAPAARADERPLRILCFGAHPDDCELQVGGAAIQWAAKGHKVKLVSTTNGDIGHWRDSGTVLAKRRKAEVEAAAKVLGVETEVLDIHDGELMPTLENRRTFVRLIREWQADIVMGPRPNDYHPDHRYTGVLMQDAAFMVAVPFFCPEAPPLKSNPVFLYYTDRFQKPAPSQPDIIVNIDDVVDRKVEALMLLESQFLEGGALASAAAWPDDPVKREQRRAEVRKSLASRSSKLADRFRDRIGEWFPADRAAKVRHIEAFEICEYGRQPDKAELRRLFPF